VPCGRRDGRISRASEVNLPGPSISVSAARSAFGAKGLNEKDMVTLLGGHSLDSHSLFFFELIFFKETNETFINISAIYTYPSPPFWVGISVCLSGG
jgi:hypothetical protein